ncbi:hypothetical protein B0H34DRAFT_401999 [Crassisporium funariophilum]|nr:hypothetical protein B0H34DRAFT_401999 [Crassisporium funariophilum]
MENSSTDLQDQLSDATRTSELFNDLSSDLVFKSSNNVLFYINRKHFESTTAGFAVPELISADTSDPVHLSEPSSTLELLFQFIQPCSEANGYRQPLVVDMDHKTLFAVAEAAEKYIVFGAMNICITRMYQVYEQYPIEVLNHCAKHGYQSLADKAAVKTIPLPHDQIALGLTHPGLTSRWLIYHSHWVKVGKEGCRVSDDYPSSCPGVVDSKSRYPRNIFSNLLLSKIPPLTQSACSGAYCNCQRYWNNVNDTVTNAVNSIPDFSSITI